MGKGEHFFLNPLVRFFKAISEPDRWLPAQVLENSGIVTVAPVHALRRIHLVAAFQLYTGDILNNVDKLINRHELDSIRDSAARESRFP